MCFCVVCLLFSAANNVKLFKHRISTNFIEKKLDRFARHRVETFVASIMLQASQAHSAFRFIIRDEQRNPFAYVRMSSAVDLFLKKKTKTKKQYKWLA